MSTETNQYDAVNTLFSTFQDWHVALTVCISFCVCFTIYMYFKYKSHAASPKDPSLVIINALGVMHKQMTKDITDIKNENSQIKNHVNSLLKEFNRHINDTEQPLKHQINSIKSEINKVNKSLTKLIK